METKKQPSPPAYRIPDVIAKDFEEFVDSVQERLPKTHKGHLAGAALLGLMLAEKMTVDALLGLVVTYTPGRYKEPQNVRLDLKRFRDALKSGDGVPTPSRARKKSKKTATA